MDPYQMTVADGDIVRLPCGALGIVTNWDILCGGNVKEVSVHPFVNCIYHFWLFITGRTRFYDEKINRLQKVPA